LTTIGRRTGRRHVVNVDFVVHDGQLFVTGANNKRDWMRNVLKNPVVEASIDGVSKRVRAETVDSEQLRATIEQLYRKKYPFASRLLRLAHKGALIFELKKTEVR
jgi:deazaflavin-dependent oxidoreductase (nitroreductase family)